MAELKAAPQEPREPAGSDCCSASAQETCCEPEAKGECCGAEHEAGTCGCSAGSKSVPGDRDELRERVRDRYAAAAITAGGGDASCCGEAAVITDEQRDAFGSSLYDDADRDALPDAAKLASLGCGNPTAVADLREGETVLDLGSGGGIDVLLSARRVGPTGKAYGLDMTDEMLALARRNQAEAGIDNAEFVRGTIEDIPLADNSVDVIISNCVINLSGDKPQVFREAARVLRPGGRFAVSDVVAEEGMDEATRRDMHEWTGCIAGALTEADYRAQLAAAGFTNIEVQETHRVHEHAASAIITARMPPCTHADSIEITALPDRIEGCEECLAEGTRWVHLRMCQSCGHIGCCDNSPGRHATAHFRATGHPIIRSAEPGEDWSWCYLDEVIFATPGR